MPLRRAQPEHGDRPFRLHDGAHQDYGSVQVLGAVTEPTTRPVRGMWPLTNSASVLATWLSPRRMVRGALPDRVVRGGGVVLCPVRTTPGSLPSSGRTSGPLRQSRQGGD